MSKIQELQDLIKRMSNGEWEHGEGLIISIIDNPGWSLRLAISDLSNNLPSLNHTSYDNGEDDWISIKLDDKYLEYMKNIIIDWLKTADFNIQNFKQFGRLE